MGFLKEFKTFIARGNVVDMAVGVVIGTAFKAIVDSLVCDIITPVISVLIGKVDIAGLSLRVSEELVIPYGSFIQNIINFIIISFSIFCTVKAINSVKTRFETKKEEEASPVPEQSKEELLLTEIRDILKNEASH